MTDFITSDTHFFHKNILKYQAKDRPFELVEEMNESIIKAWNSVVSLEDTVYHLGDFSMGHKEKTIKLRSRLNGRIVLVRGNHDHFKPHEEKQLFEDVVDYKIYRSNKRRIVMFHFPIQEWDRCYHGDIHCHGHSHGSLKDLKPNRFDMGWDVHKRIVPIEEVFSWRVSDVVPHHGISSFKEY